MQEFEFDFRWYRRNEEAAQAALRDAGAWYQPPFKPPPRIVIETDAPVTEAAPEDMPELPEFIPKPTAVILAVAHAMKLQPECIVRPRKREHRSDIQRPYINARWVCAWIMRHKLELSYPHIGRILNRDHTTILHAVRNITAEQQAVAERVLVHLRNAGVTDE